jgi:tetratricopeptide (TPR) repeat protein
MARKAAKSIAPANAADAETRTGPRRQLTCFVVTGFGNKTDYSTGRVLNLDKTFEQLIRPACDAVGINCFRAIDANLTGSIDSIMYQWIYRADLVIADLSTLNANVFYELGVRHAQRPNTTVIIAESVLVQRIPFDLSSFVVHKYDHGGDAISADVQVAFVTHLSGVLRKIIDAEDRRSRDAPHAGRPTDSPVYEFLKGMTPPTYASDAYIEPPPYVRPEDRQRKDDRLGGTLADLIGLADGSRKREDFAEAIRLFGQAIERQTGGKADAKPDVYLIQRLALVTYKHGERLDGEGRMDPQVARNALFAAEDLLARHCEPKISNDPETLGLSGAIRKRLFELDHDRADLDLAIRYYERGFYVKRDYYNGINLAYMYTQRANLLDDRFDAIVSHGHANKIREIVVEICRELIDDAPTFAHRGDREWVYLTLAEAYQGLGRTADESRLKPHIDQLATDFGRKTYTQQRAKLQAAMDEFNRRFRPEEFQTSVPLTRASGAVAPMPASGTGLRRPIAIDVDLEPGRAVKAVDIHCRIEYS